MIGDQVSHLFNVFFILCHRFFLVSLDLENASLLESDINMLEHFPAQQLPRETLMPLSLCIAMDFVYVFQLIPPSDNLDKIIS